ncbi:hypothetical protein HUF15_07810 [Streptomyces samsunensis]|uniref:Uncharacterized protein n=1 Tax=Streptomyces malaysiensis TaxID=92644 RepID=A0ABX6WB75_STRMQ|nr:MULTISPECIES: hypothetical protein [Streptomyces]MCD9589961.1 hypothetical protein [Streptomyces sp. 8ZJF_21]NUH36671.1 hypothetical protein [Streptomyces samsunensis]QPI58698.1 hypothetical protein I1A49_30710 [Streptomyces solisilvae]UHH20310.1 hypothetical protein LUV23_30910 [Streptomyces sp. HNM0561]
MRDQKMYCCPCGTDELHRRLTAAEKAWVKNETRRKSVEDIFMCKAPNCRNLRTGFQKRPFDPILRLPLPEDL